MSTELLECGHLESKHSDFTTGYGVDAKGNRYCYACCAENDKAYMREHGEITLYLTHDSYNGEGKTIFHGAFRDGKVTNWPGSLTFPARVKRGKHNIAGYRYDTWFMFEGKEWHGVQYGENSQLCYCKVNKKRG